MHARRFLENSFVFKICGDLSWVFHVDFGVGWRLAGWKSVWSVIGTQFQPKASE